MDAFNLGRISAETQATLLLRARFHAQPEAEGERPLSDGAFGIVMKALRDTRRRLGELVEGLAPLDDLGVEEARLRMLLGRGMAMSLALERWERSGIRVLSQDDAGYPARLRERLASLAPPLLFICGDPALFEAEALCVVGSRDATRDGTDAARALGRACAAAGVAVVSGGARGVDRTVMAAALERGGRCIGVLSDSLARAVLSRQFRAPIGEGLLLLASAAEPEARFTVYGAMDRNKYLYALARAAVVVDADAEGGTWSGAVENAKHGWVPAYVRLDGETRAGNRLLAERGLKPLPSMAQDDPGWIRGLLHRPSATAAAVQTAFPFM